MIIIVGHTCTLFWFIITTITRRFELLFCFVQTDSPRLILFTAMPMPMGFRKNRVQAVIDQFLNRESSSSFCRCLHIVCTIFICCTV